MKNLKVITLSLLVGILSIVFASCSQPVGGGVSEEEIIINKAFSSIVIPSVIDNDVKSITLPQEITISEEESPLMVIWQTSDKHIINLNGEVFHEDKNNEKVVTLTAKIYKNKFSKIKKYTVKVINEISSDGTLLLEAMENLTLKSEISPSECYIDLPIGFDDEKYKNISISWLSSKKDIVSDAGTVIHENSTTSYNVNLSAILELNGKTNTKSFDVVVHNDTISTEQQEFNKKVSEFNLDFNSVEGNSITLPERIPFSAINIEWKSNSALIDPKTGKVIHDTSRVSSTVILTAICSKDGLNAVKEFTITIFNNMDDASILEECTKYFRMPEIVNESTNIIYLENENVNAITKDELSVNGIEIKFESSNESVVKLLEHDKLYQFEVIHTPKVPELPVTITVTCTKGTASITKKFHIIVKNSLKSAEEIQLENDLKCVKKAKDLLIIPNVVNAFTNTISLPSSITNTECEGVNITWKSSNISVIDINGNVTHKEAQKDDSITLTATLTKGKAEEVKSFIVTVKHPSRIDPVFENAISQLPKFQFTAEEGLTKIFTLPTTCISNGKTVNIEWKITPNNHLSLSSNELTLKKDIIHVNETIQALLSYDDLSFAYEISIPLPPYNTFDEGNFIYTHFLPDNVLERKSGEYNGFRYKYSNIDPSTNTITLLKTHEYTDKRTGKYDWNDLNKDNQIKRKAYDVLAEQANTTNANPTFAQFKLFFGAYYLTAGEDTSSWEEILFKMALVQGDVVSKIPSNTPDAQIEEKWASLDDNDIKDAVLKYVLYAKQGFIDSYHIPNVTVDSPWKDITDYMKNNEVKDEVPRTYSYKIESEQEMTLSEIWN